MTGIEALFLIVLPVFLVVGSGWLAVRTRVFPDEGVTALVKFATGIAIPVLLFRAIYGLDLSSALEPALLASFYLGAIISFATGTLIARRVFGRRPGEAVAVGFCALFSNSVLIGIPIFTRAYGEPALEPVFAIIAFHAPFCYLVGILTMELSRRDGAPLMVAIRRTADEMFHNALTLGIAAGFAFNLLGIVLPEPAIAAVDLIARAGLPVALFALGGVLTRYKLAAAVPEAAATSAVSLFLHPAVAWVLATQVFALSAEFTRAAVLIAAMPTGVNGYIFAAMYDRAVGTAASTVLIATATSLLSITFWLWVLGGNALAPLP
ncbi:MAG: AEC family transporter [Pseudomonadota bacterium]